MTSTSVTIPMLATLQKSADRYGLLIRGHFRPSQADAVPQLPDGNSAHTLVLFGHAGQAFWPAFASSVEFQDGFAQPLDRWSQRIGTELASTVGATALFPFIGPPYLPFQRWARRAEHLHPSRLGLLMHPVYGLWHAYRFALALPADNAHPKADSGADAMDKASALTSKTGNAPYSLSTLCRDCATQPCLAACPVSAFSEQGFDVDSCRHYLRSDPQAACHRAGCLARNACPEGLAYQYPREQRQFHLLHYVRSTMTAGDDKPA